MANNWKSLSGLPGGLTPDTMLLLSDASVLVHNSGGADWWRLKPDGAGKYESSSWTGPFNMANTRQFFASGVLKDGRVFALGGEYSNAGTGAGDTPLGEIFDPLTESWSAMSKPSAFDAIQGDASACILADGRVLCGALSTNLTAVWDPVLDTWTVAGTAFGTVPQTRDGGSDEETWTLLADGTVLTVDISSPPNAQKYDPATDTWLTADAAPAALNEQLALISLIDTTVTPHVSVNIGEIGPAVVVPDGRLFAIGATGHTALYTPPASPTQPGSWADGPDLPPDTSGNNFNSPNGNIRTAIDAPCVLLPNGKVLLVAGNTVREVNNGRTEFWSNPSVLYVYDPVINATPVPLSKQPANNATDTWQTRFLLLPTGQVFFTSQESGALSLLTVDPALGTYQAAWKPTITSFPSSMAVGHHYKIYGRQINGLSQACSYGDDAQMATNFPIVQFTNTSTNAIVYVRSFDFSTLGIATGAAIHSTLIDIPASMPTGNYQMRVIANGIPSDPADVTIAPTLPQIAVDPQDNLNFGTVCAGPAYLSLKVFNVGNSDLIVDTVSRISGSSDFTVLPAPATPLTIGPGDQVDFTIEFQPTAPGATEVATFRITSNDPVTPNYDLTATAVGGSGALETAIADAGNFGDVCLGSFVDQDLILANDGPCMLTITNIASSSAEFLTPSTHSYPLEIAAGVSISLPLRFQPTSLGTKTATITVTSDDPAGPKTVAVSGTAPAPRLTLVMADDGSFGDVCIGHFADQPLILANGGRCPLTVTALASSSPEFLEPTVAAYPLVIECGGSITVPIRFQPASFGPATATITVTSDDPTGVHSVTMSGDTLAGKLAVTGSTYFGEVDCGFAEKTVGICNVGECALHVTSVAFKRKRRHFKLVGNPFPATLPAGACLPVTIRYTASCDPECCELVVTSDDPTDPVKCLDVVAYTRCEKRCETCENKKQCDTCDKKCGNCRCGCDRGGQPECERHHRSAGEATT
jgi:Abnormal spindle-like microcephaly-assoc'd, ASPM-SPD-2-Hydin